MSPSIMFAQHSVALAQDTSPLSGVESQQKRMRLVELLKTWEKSYSVNFGYADQDIAGKYVTAISDKKETLKEQLEQVLPPLNLSYRELNQNFYVIHRQEARPAVPSLPKNTIGDEVQSYGASPGPPSVSTIVQKAYGEDPATAGSNDFVNLTGTQLQDSIREERFRELFGEGHRWYDIRRWGIIEQELAKYPTTRVGTPTYNPQDDYLPIPLGEIDRNPNIVQSTGY